MDQTLSQLINIEQIRLLLEAHHKITGIASAVVDAEDNVLVAVGWGECPDSCEGCSGEGESISHPESRLPLAMPERSCHRALWDVALPILIEGRHLGTFFTGHLSAAPQLEGCGDLLPEEVRALLKEGEALPAPTSTEVAITSAKHLIDFFHVLVQMMAQMGGNNLELAREAEKRRKAERSHRESREFLEKIVNSVSDPIFVKDRDHRLVLVNEAVCALAGLRRDDLVGRTELSLPSEVDALWETDEAVFATGEDAVREEEVTDAEGGRRVVVTRKSLYRGTDGKAYIVGIIRDITERKRAEEDIALLNFALDNVREAAFLMDEQARFLYVNEAACRVLGYQREELLNMRLPEIAPDRPQERWRKDWEEIKELGCLTFQSRHRTRSGRVVPVEITANYFEYDRTGYTLVLVRDVSELRSPPVSP